MTEQPKPQHTHHPIIQEKVMHDIHERLLHGIKTYGMGLQVGNGRDAIRDAYEEVLDLSMYLRQILDTRDEMIKILKHISCLHESMEDQCNVCMMTYPCHTRIDIESVLHLFGVTLDDK